MPSDPKTLDALYDMRDNILLSQTFLADLTLRAYVESRLHFYAVTRAIEFISEASRRLPDEVRERHPQLPWRAIRDRGNFYRHQYDSVAESQLWPVVHDRLPALLDAVRAEISWPSVAAKRLGLASAAGVAVLSAPQSRRPSASFTFSE